MLPRHRRDPALRRRRTAPAPVAAWCAAGLLSAGAVAASFSGAVSSFTASITNDPNSATTGSVVLEETSGSTTCLSTGSGTSTDPGSATCTTINKYGGGLLVPGGSTTTTIVLTNRGTAPATSATLTGGSCTSARASGATYSGGGDLCGQLTVLVETTAPSATTVFSGTPTALAGQVRALPVPVAAGGSITVRVTVTLPSASGNTYQGMTASQPLTWTLSS